MCSVPIRRGSADVPSSWRLKGPCLSPNSPRISASPTAACATGCARPTSTPVAGGSVHLRTRRVVELRRKLRVAETEVEILRRAAAFFAKDSLPRPKGPTPSSPSAARTCRRSVLSGHGGVHLGLYAWQAAPVSERDFADALFNNTIVDIRHEPAQLWLVPVLAGLMLGENIRCSAQAGGAPDAPGRCRRDPPAQGPRLHTLRTDRQAGRRSGQGVLRSLPSPITCGDGVTDHPTDEGKVYLAVVLDAFSRRVVGWSIADHIRSELVVDAVQMAIWRRRPPKDQTIAHADHGSQYTSWAFGAGSRRRAARLHGIHR